MFALQRLEPGPALREVAREPSCEVVLLEDSYSHHPLGSPPSSEQFAGLMNSVRRTMSWKWTQGGAAADPPDAAA